jgi:type II restriction enzyme
MEYRDKIENLTSNISSTLIDFNAERTKGRMPTQVSSNFITNKEQGDWAERLVLTAINSTSKNYIAVQYGKSDDLIAGDAGFTKFYEKYQQELDDIGKRPDLLIFKKDNYISTWGNDISNFSKIELNDIVPQAIAGLEIRSSAFLIEKYETEMNARTTNAINKAINAKNIILANYKDLLIASRKKWIKILEEITEETLDSIDFRKPSWSSSQRLIELSNHFKDLKDAIKEIHKRDFLSITPKVEDLKVVNRWIEKYNVPHYYFQVFFDKVYGISFEDILKLIADSDKEGIDYFIESDTKNQNKTTIKINSKLGQEVACRIDMPEHKSKMKELARGRLLFYIIFNGGKAYLDIDNLLKLLNINEDEF